MKEVFTPIVFFIAMSQRSCHGQWQLRKSDTCGIRTHAGRPHGLSRPTPWPLGQSVNAAMNTEESFGGLHTKEGFGL